MTAQHNSDVTPRVDPPTPEDRAWSLAVTVWLIAAIVVFALLVRGEKPTGTSDEAFLATQIAGWVALAAAILSIPVLAIARYVPSARMSRSVSRKHPGARVLTLRTNAAIRATIARLAPKSSTANYYRHVTTIIDKSGLTFVTPGGSGYRDVAVAWPDVSSVVVSKAVLVREVPVLRVTLPGEKSELDMVFGSTRLWGAIPMSQSELELVYTQIRDFREAGTTTR